LLLNQILLRRKFFRFYIRREFLYGAFNFIDESYGVVYDVYQTGDEVIYNGIYSNDEDLNAVITYVGQVSGKTTVFCMIASRNELLFDRKFIYK